MRKLFAKMERRKLVAACAIVVVIIAAVVALTVWAVAKTQTQNNASDITISGEITCLPHKSTDGPQTAECAIGLRSDDNRYYGLSDAPFGLGAKTGIRLSVHGTLQPGPDSIYNTVGTIAVKSIGD